MTTTILDFFREIDDKWLYLLSGVFSYLENIIPPLPSDAIVAFCSFNLKKESSLSLALLLLINVTGGTLGFWTIYYFGSKLKKKVIKLPFFHERHLEKAHLWFQKVGYYLITLNRFFPGVRSIIGIYAGIMGLDRNSVYFLSFLSSLVWNIGLIFLGQVLAKNRNQLITNIGTYTLIGLIIAIVWVIAISYLKNKNENKST
ncbi:MAG: VTT domain-containing protein [Bdellovibrionales bacterium]|jgi:membrane protein DedA with SNARE-associated domain|nr:VTT domain-containing protein [Bdellovibrionales bacterium]